MLNPKRAFRVIYDGKCNSLFSLTLLGSAMFSATFDLVARVGLSYRIFGTLKSGSLQINSLASHNRFTERSSADPSETVFQWETNCAT